MERWEAGQKEAQHSVGSWGCDWKMPVPIGVVQIVWEALGVRGIGRVEGSGARGWTEAKTLKMKRHARGHWRIAWGDGKGWGRGAG